MNQTSVMNMTIDFSESVFGTTKVIHFLFFSLLNIIELLNVTLVKVINANLARSHKNVILVMEVVCKL